MTDERLKQIRRVSTGKWTISQGYEKELLDEITRLNLALTARDAELEDLRGYAVIAINKFGECDRKLTARDEAIQKAEEALESICRKSEVCFSADPPPQDLQSIRDHDAGRRLSYAVCARIAHKALAALAAAKVRA